MSSTESIHLAINAKQATKLGDPQPATDSVDLKSTHTTRAAHGRIGSEDGKVAPEMADLTQLIKGTLVVLAGEPVAQMPGLSRTHSDGQRLVVKVTSSVQHPETARLVPPRPMLLLSFEFAHQPRVSWSRDQEKFLLQDLLSLPVGV
ncbi:hypothetical protein PF008_g5586 [Phytophthora fragariae]|uniref:Uncharacterized protein n=1 Tax=Phytophthora fragariae TaxID=53985 RepID=A0A6G0S9N1_9STRA|nr:hypothetical protein PF008_g5586 [Phytophthora fragariae]